MSVSSVCQLLHELGLTAEQIVMAVRLIEARVDGEDFIHAMISGLETSGRPEQLGEFIEKLCPILSEVQPQRAAPRAPAKPAPWGPKERWGYDGPITPRLAERDWWPLRNTVILEADWTCHYCGERGDNMCADHVIPLSRGGSNERDNLVCCCIPCNSSKADRLLSEWRGRYR